MSFNYPIGFYVYGRDNYPAMGPDRAKVLGYFSRSLIPSTDAEFPNGELRLFRPTLTEAQQLPAMGRDFEVVNVAIDFST